jgi:hypothetical protein
VYRFKNFYLGYFSELDLRSYSFSLTMTDTINFVLNFPPELADVVIYPKLCKSSSPPHYLSLEIGIFAGFENFWIT